MYSDDRDEVGTRKRIPRHDKADWNDDLHGPVDASRVHATRLTWRSGVQLLIQTIVVRFPIAIDASARAHVHCNETARDNVRPMVTKTIPFHLAAIFGLPGHVKCRCPSRHGERSFQLRVAMAQSMEMHASAGRRS